MSGYEIRLIKTEGRQTKVWEGVAAVNGITIKYGIDGRKLRTRYIPLAQIPNGDSLRELANLSLIQQQHGFQLSWKGKSPLRGSVQAESKVNGQIEEAQPDAGPNRKC